MTFIFNKMNKYLSAYYHHGSSLSIADNEYKKHCKNLFLWMLKADQSTRDLSRKLLKNKKINSYIIAREDGVVCGVEEVEFWLKINNIEFHMFCKDGYKIKSNEKILSMMSTTHQILKLERLILNLMQRMSGIASMTNSQIKKYSLGKNSHPYLAATRKTPWMLLDKKAVWVGGGLTHRLSLGDRMMIKDTHLDIIKKQDGRNRFDFSKMLDRVEKIMKNSIFEIEVNTESQAINFAKIYLEKDRSNKLILMLDNFTPDATKNTISNIRRLGGSAHNVFFELSGGINSNNLGDYVSSGADVISLGELTHSSKALNLSLYIK